VHFLSATHRKQIGDHNVTITVKSDLVPISTSVDIKFKLAIKDCYLQNFQVGTQALKSIILDFGKSTVFPFKNYTQVPRCDFPVNYTITLVKKAYSD